MDEVKAMTHAGETVGRAVGTGLRTFRHGAMHAGQAGVDAVRDLAADSTAEVVATTRRARRQLVREARRTARSTMKDARATVKDTRRAAKAGARDLTRGAKQARKQATRTARGARGAATDVLASARPARNVARSVRSTSKKAKRSAGLPPTWTLLAGAGTLVAGGAAFAVIRRQQRAAARRAEQEIAEVPEQDRFATNGSAPSSRSGRQANQRN